MKELLQKITALKAQIASVFVGRAEIIHKLCTGFFSGLHVLIEDIPGVGKTTLAKALAASTGCDFGRVQFTPDLLPGDILGMTVFSMEKREFVFKPGAIMHQLLLADEINRASPRTQSSLLQAMQERVITVDDRTLSLPELFYVIATQNPADFTGTFPLPEAQLDRFGISFAIGYPQQADETLVLSRFREHDPLATVQPVMSTTEVAAVHKLVRAVFYNELLNNYLLEIIDKTRHTPEIKLGASPRAAQHLLLASQAHAFLSGRDYLIPDDVLTAAALVLPHRLILSAEAKMQNLHPAQVVSRLLAQIPRPAGIN